MTDPAGSDWVTFQAELHLPLSPAEIELIADAMANELDRLGETDWVLSGGGVPGPIRLTALVPADDPYGKGMATLRTLLHAIGVATPGWEQMVVRIGEPEPARPA